MNYYLQEIYNQNLVMENNFRTPQEWQNNLKSKLCSKFVKWIKPNKIQLIWTLVILFVPVLFVRLLLWALGLECILTR